MNPKLFLSATSILTERILDDQVCSGRVYAGPRESPLDAGRTTDQAVLVGLVNDLLARADRADLLRRSRRLRRRRLDR